MYGVSGVSSSVGGDATRGRCRRAPRNPERDVIMRKLLERDRVLSVTYGVGGKACRSELAHRIVRLVPP